MPVPLTGNLTLPDALGLVLDAAQVPLPAAVLRAFASTMVPDQTITAERLGRVASYEEQSTLKSRKTPRFCWAIDEDGVAVSPRLWARGEWSLARRVMTEDVAAHWQAGIASLLAEQMVRGPDKTRAELFRFALQSAGAVLGPVAMFPPGDEDDWAAIRAGLAARHSPLGPAATTVSQDQAAVRLGAQLTSYSLYFGVGEGSLVRRGDEYPPRLRLALESEPLGRPFDELVLAKTGGDHRMAQEVFAFVQEWDYLTDKLERPPSPQEYAEHWRVDRPTLDSRIDAFRSVFPTETNPSRVMRLLWDNMDHDGGLVRILGRRVVEEDGPPTVLNHFVNCLAFELRNTPSLGNAVYRAAAPSDGEAPDPPRELRRFLALCDHALRMWCASALLAEGDEAAASLAGLPSIGRIYDERTASFAEGMLGQYRRDLPAGPSRRLLLCVQKALRTAATVNILTPPATTAPYLIGVQWAAKALAEATAQDIRLEPVEETSEVTRMLAAVH